MNLYMIDCTGTIIRAVEAGLPQKEIGWDYGQAMRSEAAGVDNPDWSAINGAILKRWKMSGLERIKKIAWKINAPR
jgi:hypothetical protein